ncbi:hypothetical protein QE364_000114 [Nocardioides zeae]|uniref:Uncharacterized protein n=1 Tax=Nocardioides zeae TaxID=1457234 RepID=A0ACC6ICH7_9ACTN|nr:hypothetical protein [Nocardioides zeae]MDR6175495.1 hypothetical protein [Nocardioides zeae]MDR6208426.1 hypothetical protein [Nocardioides zeae]
MTLGQSRLIRITAAAAFVIGATATAAHAATGSTPLARSVVFYFGETSGSGDSKDFAGYGIGAPVGTRLCSDADNYGNNSYGAQFIRNRTLQPDDVLKDVTRTYNQGLYTSASFNTYSNYQYHTRAAWSAVPSAPNNASGFARSGSGGC